MEEQLNLRYFDYAKAAEGVDVGDLKKRWLQFQEEYPECSDESLTTDNLDEYQLLFVSLVLDHVEKTLEALHNNFKEPEPLRLMLLGTAGTGKSTATQTMLQELRRRLRNH